MSQRSDGKVASMEDVSALIDGELDESAVARACAQWRVDASAREAWHAYQLIGDVLRSDDLASTASRDSAFLASLRERLAAEPVVLAPQPVAAPAEILAQPAVANARAGGRRHWHTPAAVVAGFAVVASVLVVTRMPAASDTGAGLAARDGSPPIATLASTAAPSPASGIGSAQAFDRQVEQPSLVLDGQLVRDARLDEYLAAHKKFGGSSGPGVPSGFLRNAAATTMGR